MFYNYKDIKINYETIGDGIDIVFLHGWGANKEIFKNLTNEIKNKYKVTLIDLPTFGLSTGSRSVITVFDIKDAILSLINYLNIQNPILVGHSYGGKIASLLAATINTNKLILIDSAGIKRFNVKKIINIFIYKIKKKFYKFTKQVMKYNNLICNSGSIDYLNSNIIQKEMLKTTVNEDFRKIFKQIKCETLLFWGESDQTTKLKDGKLINKLIKNSSLIIIPNASHFPFLENPYYFKKVFNTYLGV